MLLLPLLLLLRNLNDSINSNIKHNTSNTSSIINDTLNVILKYEGDVQKAQGELAKLIERKSAEQRAEGPQKAPAPPESKKGILH